MSIFTQRIRRKYTVRERRNLRWGLLFISPWLVGFVLYLTYDAANSRTAVDVLDARGIDADPLARLWLRNRVPMGFHGNYQSAS